MTQTKRVPWFSRLVGGRGANSPTPTHQPNAKEPEGKINNRYSGRNQVRKKELRDGFWWEMCVTGWSKVAKNREAKKLILKEAGVLDGP